MNEVGDTLESMTAVQLVAALLFVAGYMVALGQLATRRGRRWGASLAALSAIVFVAFTRPWEHGVILMALGSTAVAVFVAVAWGFNCYFERRHATALALLAAAEAAARDAGVSDSQPAAVRSATSPARPPVREPASSH